MARPLRIAFPGAIYHVMARGNARQPIFRAAPDYQRLLTGLETTVDKFGFEVFSFVCMPNHLHLFFRTPQANLSQGMQYLLSGYANWFATRHQRPGHLFQGRFKGELVEDESYFWNVSRYVHLNPVRGRRPLVERPEDWPWSSYPGYYRKRRRVDWLAYDALYRAWQGKRGGHDAARAYRSFVDAGIDDPPANPLAGAIGGWLLGGQEFVDRIRKQLRDPKYRDEVPAVRRLTGSSLDEVLAQTAVYFGVDVESFTRKHSKTFGRDAAAWLARRLTTATLRELASPFGLSHPDSVRGLINRAEAQMQASPKRRREIEAVKRRIEQSDLPKHEKRV